MMKKLSSTIFLLFWMTCVFAQGTFYFADSTIFSLGDSTQFYAGGNTTFDGELINNGEIISYSNIDFGENSEVGSLSFVGPGDQSISGDTILVIDFEVDKESGEVILLSEQVVVEGTLDVINGVIDSENEEDLIVTGSSLGEGGDGYVEGNLVGLASNGTLTFPMGLNDYPNYITLTTDNLNAIFRVECRLPLTDRLRPTEDMVGIADEVEWVITTTNQDSVEVSISTLFSGVDLTNFSNGQSIRAQAYSPTVVKLGPNDTIYQDLGVAELLDDLVDVNNLSSGTLTSADKFYVSQQPTYLSVALIPQLLRPAFFIPNAFSPTASIEENRVFRPYFTGANVTVLQMEVFDQFQNRLYSVSENGDNLDLSGYGWDGLLSGGQSSDEGVYYYNIRIVAGGNEYKKVGSFILVN